LAKLKWEATLKRIDSLLSILEEDTLKKLLNLFQKAKAKTYANRYLEAKIWLQLNN
jgi:hypothetical protein